MRSFAGMLWIIAQAATAAQAGALTIAFTRSSVMISGVSASAPVYVFRVVRERKPSITDVYSLDATVSETGGSGAVTVDYDHDRTWRSLWLAVDIRTGTFAIGAPPDYPWAKQVTIASTNLKKDSAGDIAQLAMTGDLVDFVVVRPQVGVWSAAITSMGALDDAKQNGKITVSVGNLTPRAGTTDPAPKKLKKGDIVFIANSFTGEYGAAVVE